MQLNPAYKTKYLCYWVCQHSYFYETLESFRTNKIMYEYFFQLMKNEGSYSNYYILTYESVEKINFLNVLLKDLIISEITFDLKSIIILIRNVKI